jgi:hypothetical protein
MEYWRLLSRDEDESHETLFFSVDQEPAFYQLDL